MQEVVLIAALAANGVIGKGGQLPFHLPQDLAHFKQLTTGKTVLMGRKTYESLPPSVRPLPNRTNIVLTRQTNWHPHPKVQVIQNLAELQEPEIWVLGGAEIYALMLPHATRLELTEVRANIEGDTYFPRFDKTPWRETARSSIAATATTPAFDFVTYLRQ